MVWEKVSSNPDLGWRPWYYQHVIAHPTDGDTVFVFSTGELRDPLNANGPYFKSGITDIHLQVDILGHAAATAVQESIYDACRQAQTVSFEAAHGGVVPAAG